MASALAKEHVFCDQHLNIVIVGAEPHFFQPSDVGKKFVRTQPHWDDRDGKGIGDKNFLAKGQTEKSIRSSALMLVNLTQKHLEFLRSSPSMYRSTVELPINYAEEDWNDGYWIEIDKCIEICKKSLNAEIANSIEGFKYLPDSF